MKRVIITLVSALIFGQLVGCKNENNSGVNKQNESNATAKDFGEVVVTTNTEGENTKLTCTFPQLTFDNEPKPYTLNEISVSDSKGNIIPTNHKTNQPTVTFMVPTNKLAEINIDAQYIDARVLNETTKDPNKRIDWAIRPKQFKLVEILKKGEPK